MRRTTRRDVLSGAAAAVAAATVLPDAADAATRKRRRKAKPKKRKACRRTPTTTRATPDLGTGGAPTSLAVLAALAKTTGRGEPLAFVDLAAVDRNCERVLSWCREQRIDWRPAYKTLESPELLKYVVDKLDAPRALIHHLRTLPQAMRVLPAGTDWLMGYPPTLGELEAYLTTPPAKDEKPYVLRILIDSTGLLQAADRLARRSARPGPVRIALELENGTPRGGFVPGEHLAEALRIIGASEGRLRLESLFCYDVLGAADGNNTQRKKQAEYCEGRLRDARAQTAEQAARFVDVDGLILNGPGSANYRNWTGGIANEISPGSAILYANYLDDPGYDVAGLHKALFLCAPVLRIGATSVAAVPQGRAPKQFCFIKAGGWPTGNNPTLSKMVWPKGLEEGPLYGRGANSSGMILAPRGTLQLGEYVLETCRQVMEGQDYFAALYAVRESKVRAKWPVLQRWTGERDELLP